MKTSEHKQKHICNNRLAIWTHAIRCALVAATIVTVFFLSGCGPSTVPTDVEPTQSVTVGTTTVYDGLMVFAMDVGQGDCFLLVSPNGRTMLIDSGEASETEHVIAFLNEHDIQYLDLIVATHPHTDHIGGLSRILTEFDAGALLLPQVESNTKMYKELLNTADMEQVELIYVWSGDEVTWDKACTIDILSPVEGAEYSVADMNEWSIMMRVSYGETSMMFTGDVGIHAEQVAMFFNERELFKADVLKVAHHGSAYSTSVGFLETVDPDIAVISAGENNSYGHPDFDTLNKLKLMGIEVYRTDQMGDISILLDGDAVTVNGERP